MASGSRWQAVAQDPWKRELLQLLARRDACKPGSPTGQTLRQLASRLPAWKAPDGPAGLKPEVVAAARELIASGLVELVAPAGREPPGRRPRRQASDGLVGARLRLTPAGQEAARRLLQPAAEAAPQAERKQARPRRTATAATPAASAPPAARAAPATSTAPPSPAALETLAERVGLLEARVASLLERLERLEAWQRSLADDRARTSPSETSSPAGEEGRAPSAPPAEPPTLDTFREWLLATLDRLDRENRRLGLVPVPRVRQALADRVSGPDFDRLVLELAARREVFLVPHDRPAALPPEERQACLRDPALGQVYYWFRWRM